MKGLLYVSAIVALVFVSGLVFGDETAPDAADAAVEAHGFVPPSQELLFKIMDRDAFTPLFKDDLSNAVMEEGGWAFENGELAAQGKGDIWTKERYGDFLLSLEFQCVSDTNSGVFLRCGDLDDWLHTSIEVQILQNNEDYENAKWHCAAIFDCLEPQKQLVRAPGEWNTYMIIAKDNMIWVFLNQELVTSMDLDLWTEAGKNPDGTGNKFRDALKDMPREGHIGLQYHGQPIRFRDIVIQPID